MKRYIPSIDGNGSPIMEESLKGRYYSRADLIAAGVLVPVPDGGIRSFLSACDAHCEYVIWNGKVCRIDSLEEGVDVIGRNRNYPITNTIGVQPVRLVKLEDLP